MRARWPLTKRKMKMNEASDTLPELPEPVLPQHIVTMAHQLASAAYEEGCAAADGMEAEAVRFDKKCERLIAAIRRYSEALACAQPARKLWLWKNFVDGRPEYWAFDNPYPTHLDNGDPQTLGQPCGYTVFKPSRDGSCGRTEDFVLREMASVAASAAVPVVQQEPVAWMWQHDETGMTGFVEHAPADELRQWERMNRPRKIVTPLYAAPQARQEPKPDSVYLTSSSGEAATARDAARYRWWRLYAVGEDCSHDEAFLECETSEHLDALIDAALSSTQGDGGTAGASEFCRFPDCRCPMDPGPEPDWCAKGLPHAKAAAGVAPVEAPSLHQRITNLPCDDSALADEGHKAAFRLGHKHARHAAAGLAAASGVAASDPCTAPDCDCEPGWCREHPAPKRTKGVTDGVAPSDEWAEAERVRDLPAVDDAIRNFLIDSTGDNSTAVVREILRAAGVKGPDHG